MTDQKQPTDADKAMKNQGTTSIVRDADGDRPVHMLVRTEGTSQGGEALADFEVFTAEIKARRALDTRDRDWRYLQVLPGKPYSEARAAQQGQLGG